MGIVSFEKNFVFIHVPKTAGTSLRRVLEGHGASFRDLPDLLASAGDRGGIRHPNHLRARDVQRFFGSTWGELYSFCVVRNPWDWVVSNYHFIRQSPQHRLHAATASWTFADFVRNMAEPRPQNEWILDDAGKQLVTEVIPLEQLHEAYPRLMAQCGISPAPELPRLNASKREDYRTSYDDSLADIISRRYAEEIRLFGYKF